MITEELLEQLRVYNLGFGGDIFLIIVGHDESCAIQNISKTKVEKFKTLKELSDFLKGS